MVWGMTSSRETMCENHLSIGGLMAAFSINLLDFGQSHMLEYSTLEKTHILDIN